MALHNAEGRGGGEAQRTDAVREVEKAPLHASHLYQHPAPHSPWP